MRRTSTEVQARATKGAEKNREQKPGLSLERPQPGSFTRSHELQRIKVTLDALRERNQSCWNQLDSDLTSHEDSTVEIYTQLALAENKLSLAGLKEFDEALKQVEDLVQRSLKNADEASLGAAVDSPIDSLEVVPYPDANPSEGKKTASPSAEESKPPTHPADLSLPSAEHLPAGHELLSHFEPPSNLDAS